MGIAALGVEAVQVPRIGKKGKGQIKNKGSTEIKRMLIAWYNETNGSNRAPRGTTILDFLNSFDEEGNGEDGVDAGHVEVGEDGMHVGGEDDDDLEIPIVMEGYESPVMGFRQRCEVNVFANKATTHSLRCPRCAACSTKKYSTTLAHPSGRGYIQTPNVNDESGSLRIQDARVLEIAWYLMRNFP